MSTPVAPGRLQVGSIYLDRDGRRWGVLERDHRGGARLVSPPEDAPNWHRVTLDPDGAWWEGEQRVERDPYLEATSGYLSCVACRRYLKVSPRTAAMNHDLGCRWLADHETTETDEPQLPAVTPEDWDPSR